MPRERREALLDEFERSGLSGAKFAALCGVKHPSFAGWVQQRRRARAGTTGPGAGSGPLQWLEALLPERAGGTPLLLHLPGGGRMEITAAAHAPLAAAVLRALAAHGPGLPGGKEAVC